MSNLLSVSADAKTVKGEKQGYLTGILYLAPHTIAKVGNLCPNASPGCMAACLYTAGRGVFTSVQKSRIKKTRAFHKDRVGFMHQLEKEIRALLRKADRMGLTPLVRLNGTSDLPWENLKFPDGSTLFERFPGVQFYDYTKQPRRMEWYLGGTAFPRNYRLVFSRSECNEQTAINVLRFGGSVAVVFSTKRGEPLPTEWHGYTVIDGDVSDVRPNDPRGVVVGLRAKGKARRDASGFVVRVGG